MDNQVNLADVTDVNELYKMHFNCVERLEQANREAQVQSQNIVAIRARLGQLENEKKPETKK